MAYALVTYTPQPWQTPTPGYYDSENWGYITPHHHYRRPGYSDWRLVALSASKVMIYRRGKRSRPGH